MSENRTPLFFYMNTAHQFMSFAIFILASVGVGVLLGNVFPGLPLFVVSVLGMLTGFALSAVLSVGWAKNDAENRAQAAREYQAMRELDSQKKIDEMLRRESNIPEVRK